MLKKLLSLLCILSIVGAVRSQSTILVGASDTIRVDTTLTSSAGHVVRSFMFRNNSTTDTLKMTWRVVSNTFPHTDTFSFCDLNNCYSSTQILGNSIRFTFYPQGSGLMKLDFAPQCVATNGVFRVHMYATNDSANTDVTLTYIYNMATNCANGINDIDVSQIGLYPNPARNEMRVNLPSGIENGQIDVYNLIGSKVYSQSVGKGKEIDISSLESGLYVARISENGKLIATRKFTKTEE